MKINCSGAHFGEALGIVSSIVPPRGANPVLQHVKIVAEKNGVHLYATDLDIMIHYKAANVEVAKPGIMALPAQRITQILKEITKDKVTVEETASHTATIKGKGSEFKVLGIDPSEFPDFPDIKADAREFDIDREDLLEMIKKTVFAVSMESTHKYALSGTLIDLKGGELRMVSTDSRRLALCKKRLSGKEKGKEVVKAIVPPKTLRMIEKLLLPSEKTVKCLIEDNQIKFITQSAEIISKLIEGNFPDYEQVIPAESTLKIEMNTADLNNAVRQAALMTNPEQGRAVKMQFSKNKMTIYTRSQDVGEAKIELSPVPYDKKEDFEIAFNPDYLMEGLRAAETETVVLELQDAQTPCVIKAGKDYVYLIMPLAVNL